MAEPTTEKPKPTIEDQNASQTHSSEEAGEIHHRKSWMYRSPRIGPVTLPYYASPLTQLILVAFVCFLCPGMYNSLTGLGGAGQLNATAANNGAVATYSTFSVVGFFAGSIANRIGIKLTLSLGGIGYFVYSSSLLCFNHTQNAGFVIFAGALLGLCAGLLWAAQGSIMMSYPPEGSKGRYIFIFWVIFNLGGVIGSLIPLGQNMHSTVDHVNDGTYVAFMVLMFLGAVLAWFLCDSKHVERPDGSHVIIMKNPTWKSEILGLLEVLKTDWYIIALFPMFFSSNWFYTYHFNGVNLARFNIRTRALNNVLYWSSQMIGASVFGNLLDIKSVRRTTRAKAAWAALFTITMAIWGGGYAWQRQYTRATVDPASGYKPWDWTHSGYVGGMFLYIFYGFYDASWQTCVYWFMGSLTNNGRKLANFAGFYKGIQSAGAAIMWRLDALKIPYMNEFASCWALLGGSLLIALPVILLKVQDTVPVEQDLKFSDETAEEVAASNVLQHEAAPPFTTDTEIPPDEKTVR
ncbi:MFS general substrate transporter [Xylona heveae TC161]|uniref:MFS general substrate transporter n=1 Tax=Xylona heveae (strain CBS 132557 / TC161) TaxID=1328760 RepID=A0A165H0U7_XYLHT|nr:MFS general substrate transporter [Xylona heveae TC161]KZF22845.1 MFS general substrate transporter [Xylona heveae TC161]